MNIITKKVRLIPAPFVGTSIKIKLEDPESLTWGMSSLTLHEDRERAIIDWGDGSRTELSKTGEAIHDYAAPGEYEVRISDDIYSIRCSSVVATDIFRTVYAQRILEFHTNATELGSLATYCFRDAANLRVFGREGGALTTLLLNSFGCCSSLIGRIDLPHVTLIHQAVFHGDAGITEFHFSQADEETIRASAGWLQSGGKFGAENATAFFDL